MNGEQIGRTLGLRQCADGQYTGRCPACGYKTGFTVKDRQDALPLIYCHTGKCTFPDLVMALQRLALWPDRGSRRNSGRFGTRRPAASPQPRADDQEKRQYAWAMWDRGKPIGRSLAETYLRQARGYLGPLPPYALRFASGRHRETGDRWHPMMVAAVVVADQEFVGVHRTFLGPDGLGKADVQEPKMSLAPIDGGSIPLFPAGPELVIGEGIENSLSAGHALGLPSWCAISSGNLPKVILPSVVRSVIIAADRDANGIGLRKANEAAQRWSAAGLHTRVIEPPAGAGDWNDLLRNPAA